MTKTATVGLIMIAIITGLFCGYFIWMPRWDIPFLFKYDVIKDTLMIVLTTTAIVITVAGTAVYLILSERLKRDSEQATRIEGVKNEVHLCIVLGYTFWEVYDNASPNNKNILDVEIAIRLTQRALIFHNQLPPQIAHIGDNERKFCLIKNNLAYYLAIRKRSEDKTIAREYIEYIRERIDSFAEEKDNWLDTYNFVKQQYPD